MTGQTARAARFHEIADWFATLARAEETHAGRFKKGLDKVAEVNHEPDAG
ncbi:MAG: ferritin family protein [Frankiaceae bacterium]